MNQWRLLTIENRCLRKNYIKSVGVQKADQIKLTKKRLECQNYSVNIIFKNEYKMHAGSIHAWYRNLQYFFQILMFWIFFVFDALIKDCILHYIELWLEVTESKDLFGTAPRVASRPNLVGALPNSFLLWSDPMLILWWACLAELEEQLPDWIQ